MVESDTAFVRKSWKASYRFSKDARGLRDSQYYAWMDKTLDQVFDRKPLALVAVKNFLINDVQVEKIVGFIVAEHSLPTTVVHFLYVKQSHRRNKVAKRLLHKALTTLPQGQLVYTFQTHHQPLATRYGFAHVRIERILHSNAA